MTTLDRITDRCSIAGRAAEKLRAERTDWKAGSTTDMLGYRMGEAAAYNDAHRLMKAELERLRNLWQNGSITYSDFTGV
jgi:hypothetical protein